MTGESLASFLDRLASPAPTPAGGAATAMTGALSAALLAMVSRVTAERSAPGTVPPEIEQEAEALRARLTALVQEDADAYGMVIEARRVAAERRPHALRTAFVKATEIPVEIARAGARFLALCDRLAPSARASTVSDLGVAGALALAAMEGATLTARVNLRDLDDGALVSRFQETLALLAEEAAAARHRVAQVVAARTGLAA